MAKKDELESAIAELEAMRDTLGDIAVDAAQAGLRQELEQLAVAAEARATAPSPSTPPWRGGPEHYSGDHRPNSGMYEGVVEHAEVNGAIRDAEKVILFGQQNRLRSRRLMADDRLPRIKPGHRLSKFFYGGVRQIPERLLDALLARKVSVTMVRGRDLLVFHDQRRHQSFHAGRTRRTIYLPEPILEQAYQAGYDYWAIAEILIQESWPLLDYILLLEFVERCQIALEERSTLGYSFTRQSLRELNLHMRDLSDSYQDLAIGIKSGDEFAVFLDHYAPKLFELDWRIRDRDPYDVTDEIYDDPWERFTGRAKLSEVAAVNSFPTYFMIDRDIVHPAAIDRAEQLGLPADPQTPDAAVHDLWDETRFKGSLSVRTEELLELIISMSAPGIAAFLRAVSFEYAAAGSHGMAADLNRHGALGVFRRKMQGYSGSGLSELPGTVAYDLRMLQEHYRRSRRTEYLEQLRALPRQALVDQAHGIRATLTAIVDETVSRDRAAELKSAIATSRDLAGLIDAVEGVVEPTTVETEHELLAGILYKLDEHSLYQKRFLPDCKKLNGGRLPGPPSIRPEVQRLAGFMPERYFELTSDPGELGWYLAQFRDTDTNDPYNRLLFTWIAGVLVRYDQSEDFGDMCQQIVMLGEYARPPLQDIAGSELYYGREGRGKILRAAQMLLPKLPEAPAELHDDWHDEVNRRRGLELDPDGETDAGRRRAARESQRT